MYAIFEDGGKQYKVSSGDTILVERRDLPEGGNEITFDRVLMLGEGGDARLGQPWLSGASVSATVLDEIQTPKVRGIKFRRRKRYLKHIGHRQKMLRVKIGSING